MTAASIVLCPCLFDSFLAGPVLVRKGDDILGGASHVGDNEANARVKFAWMPFDLVITRRGFVQFALVGEVREGAPDVKRGGRQAALSRQPMRSCKTRLAGTGWRSHPFAFEKFVDLGIGEAASARKLMRDSPPENGTRPARAGPPIHRRCARRRT